MPELENRILDFAEHILQRCCDMQLEVEYSVSSSHHEDILGILVKFPNKPNWFIKTFSERGGYDFYVEIKDISKLTIYGDALFDIIERGFKFFICIDNPAVKKNIDEILKFHRKEIFNTIEILGDKIEDVNL